ncbi:MAG: ornithine carbamoyltransferase [Rickettsiaceae bacterium]|jgi:ornithine carbamoyltransferase|nr:ornithine carbamoyltransferase [Rickettsiaceae bacterium]
MKHFIDLSQIAASELKNIITAAKKLKKLSYQETKNLLPGKNLAMIFEKPSTRTRVSFEAGINQLGGSAIVMNKNDMQLGKGETIADTAKVLSRLVDVVMVRCKEHNLLLEMAQNSTIPIINALSDYSHPCQILASILTIEEHLGNIENKTLAWFGDANNVLNSYIHGALAFGYVLNIAIPKELDFCNQEIAEAKKKGAKINIYHDAKSAAKNADVLITDTWISMGQGEASDEKAKQEKLKLLMPFQVNEELMNLANPQAIFTHCLPAYRGFEVTETVIDGKKSVVFDEAENRLHAQKAILLWLFDVKI